MNYPRILDISEKYSLQVVDPATGNNLGPFEKGELWIKSGTLMSGYFKSNTTDVINKEGWLQTGDTVYYDEIYCFHVVGRVSTVFKYQDWFVNPKVIEGVLMTHPLIKDAAVVPIPNEEDVNHPFGLVVLEKTTIKITSPIIIHYVEERVHDSHRLRGGLRIVESIPVTKSAFRNRSELCNIVLTSKLHV